MVQTWQGTGSRAVRTYLDCIPCFLRQTLEVTRLVSGQDEVMAERALRRVLTATHSFRLDLPPPYMGRQIHRIIREVTGCKDPYADLKQKSTETALVLSKSVEQSIQDSSHPFRAAVRFSIAGNVMDYANASGWDGDGIDRCIDDALSKPLDEDALNTLERDAGNAKDILFIADNAGETVFDRLLIQRLPQNAVTYVVKGAPVINDATREDAEMAGIGEVARIVDTGSDAPGTILDFCSTEFCEVFDEADLVIAKGQANLETLFGCHREVFFLTQIKCPVIARNVGGEVGEWRVEHWLPQVGTKSPKAAAEAEV